MRQIVYPILRWSLIVAGLYFFLKTSFSARQALALAFIAGTLAEAYIALAKSTIEFEPFAVRIRPHLLKYLRDTEAIDATKCEDIRSALSAEAKSSEALMHGFTLVVLGLRLYYWHEKKTFSSAFKAYESISELQPQDRPAGSLDHAPSFEVEVNLVKQADGASIRCVRLIYTPAWLFGEAKPESITLATLPYDVFLGRSGTVRDRNKLDERVAENGWKYKESFGWGVEHEYAEINMFEI